MWVWCSPGRALASQEELNQQGGVAVHELPGFRLIVRWSPAALRNMLSQQVCACLLC